MESASEMVPFPLLPTPIESNYRACTIPYRFPSDNPRKPTPTEIAWIDLFLNSVPSFKLTLLPFLSSPFSSRFELYQTWVVFLLVFQFQSFLLFWILRSYIKTFVFVSLTKLWKFWALSDLGYPSLGIPIPKFDALIPMYLFNLMNYLLSQSLSWII